MGVLIENKIALDCKNRQNEDCVYFISNISRNCGFISKILPDNINSVYTSEFNSWLLQKFFGVDEGKLIGVQLESETELNIRGFKFTFEFFDANHCPGAVMILLKGTFGSILYSGACRYHPKMMSYKSLSPFCVKETLDKFYIDGHYYCENIDFPSQDEVIRNAVQLIDAHKTDCKAIFICSRLLGMEKALAKIALELNVNICVDKQKYQILKKLGVSSLFTKNSRKTTIHTIDFKDVTRSKLMKRREIYGNCITIVMSALYKVIQSNVVEDYKNLGVFILPYSEHNSSSEAKLMGNVIHSKKVIYLNKYQKNEIACGQSINDEKIEVVDLDSEEICQNNTINDGSSPSSEINLHFSEEFYSKN